MVLTPEPERYTKMLKKKLGLPFEILTDLHLETAERYRLVHVLPEYLRDVYKSFGVTLDRFHDGPDYRLPTPARDVMSPDGVIRAADVNADYTLRPDPAETVRILQSLADRPLKSTPTRAPQKS